MTVVLYTIGCPSCNILEKKLNDNNIKYTIADDLQKAIDAGFDTAPVLEVDGVMMDYIDAITWIKKLNK